MIVISPQFITAFFIMSISQPDIVITINLCYVVLLSYLVLTVFENLS